MPKISQVDIGPISPTKRYYEAVHKKTNSAAISRSKIPRIVLQKVGRAKFSKIFVQFSVSHEPASVPDIFNLLFRYICTWRLPGKIEVKGETLEK
jgi:hypothetical protein